LNGQRRFAEATDGSSAPLRGQIGEQSLPEGWYSVDHMISGKLVECVDGGGAFVD